MVKRLSTVLRGLMSLTVLALASPAIAAQPQSMTFVMEKFPPFIVDDDGQGAGPFPEVVRAACESMKIRCTLKLLPWRRALAMAEMGTVDGIFVLARNKDREKAFHFSDPIFESSFAVFARTTDFVYSAPKDLSGFTVATYGPSQVSKEINELSRSVPQMKLIVEIDNQSVLRKLRGGRYPEPAAAVMNREVGLELIEREQLTGLRMAGQFKPVDYAIGFPRKRVSEERAEEFNRTLRTLIRQGTVKAIADKYGLKPAS